MCYVHYVGFDGKIKKECNLCTELTNQNLKTKQLSRKALNPFWFPLRFFPPGLPQKVSNLSNNSAQESFPF